MRPPVALSKLVKHLGTRKQRTAVVVGTVTDDMRLLELPSLEIAALRFTEAARARVTKAGGTCLTIDELIMKSPSGANTLLLRGPTMREAKRHFGSAGGLREAESSDHELGDFQNSHVICDGSDNDGGARRPVSKVPDKLTEGDGGTVSPGSDQSSLDGFAELGISSSRQEFEEPQEKVLIKILALSVLLVLLLNSASLIQI
jgi:hypothetical protein